MIIKELDPFTSEDPLLKAGRTAEEQMAFYLRRAFGDDSHILVFNSLRIEAEGDAAQIDHLILHRHGMIIIESKSVTSRVQINHRGEWIRWYDRASKGMPSPVEQAKRQWDFLRLYLSDHAELLRGKVLLGALQARFGAMPNAVLVAISDSGIVERPKSPVLPVFKADQIVDQVKLLIKEHKRISSPFNLSMKEFGDTLNKEEIDRVSNFLLQHHRPLQPTSPQKKASTPVPDAPSPLTTQNSPFAKSAVPQTAPRQGEWACKQCKGSQLRIECVYSYFFKCLTCGANTAIQLTCTRCGAKEKTRKSGSQFFRECETCGTSTQYYTNS